MAVSLPMPCVQPAAFYCRRRQFEFPSPPIFPTRRPARRWRQSAGQKFACDHRGPPTRRGASWLVRHIGRAGNQKRAAVWADRSIDETRRGLHTPLEIAGGPFGPRLQRPVRLNRQHVAELRRRAVIARQIRAGIHGQNEFLAINGAQAIGREDFDRRDRVRELMSDGFGHRASSSSLSSVSPSSAFAFLTLTLIVSSPGSSVISIPSRA